MASIAGVTFKWNSQWLEKEVTAAMQSRMHTATEFLRSEVVKSISTSSRSGGPSLPKQPPHANTGHLRQSIFGEVTTESKSVTGSVGTTVIYGAALELGATIRPKTKKALTIPLTDKAGKYPAPKFPKPLTLVWPKGKKHGWLVETTGKMSIMHYLLTRGPVKLAARPYLRPALNTHWPTISKILKTGRK